MVHNVKEQRIKTLLKRTKGENTEILFHHRYSTSTPDVRNACHPFSTKDTFDFEYIGVHNGVINNADELKREHVKLGIEYVSNQPEEYHRIRFNDSEALIYDLARYFEGYVDKLTAKGNDAFVVIRMNSAGQPQTLFFGHNSGSPLKMKNTKTNIVVSSLGDGDEVPIDTLMMYDYETGILSSEPMTIPPEYSWNGYSKSAPTNDPGTTNTPYNAKATNRSSSKDSVGFHGPSNATEDEEWRDWSETSYGKRVQEAYTRAGFSNEDDFDDGDSDLTENEQAMIDAEMAKLDLEDEEGTLQLDLQDFPNSNVTPGSNPGAISLEKFYGISEDSDFVIIPGNKTSVQASFLKSSYGIHDALVKARDAQSVAMDELNRLNNLVNHIGNNTNELEKIIDYYGLVSEYTIMLSEICDNFKTAAQRFADKEDVGKSESGFQVSAHTN